MGMTDDEAVTFAVLYGAEFNHVTSGALILGDGEQVSEYWLCYGNGRAQYGRTQANAARHWLNLMAAVGGIKL
jgi:hypothetical protein